MGTELLFGLIVAREIYDKRFAKLMITSCRDGRHSSNSYHYKGLAADLRTRGTGLSTQIRDDLVVALGHLGFDVILEDLGGPNEHIHMEYDLRKATDLLDDHAPVVVT
jgi:hypothetical protein